MDRIGQLAAAVGDMLAASGDVLVTAESCTGGWVAQAVTSVAGSSAWFDRGYVTYSNTAKREMLGVPQAVLDEHGVVSAVTVEAMARGALAACGASVSVSVSGIAGPGGATPSKPVGTVWLAWARADGATHSACRHFCGDRESVRRQATELALSGLLELPPATASGE